VFANVTSVGVISENVYDPQKSRHSGGKVVEMGPKQKNRSFSKKFGPKHKNWSFSRPFLDFFREMGVPQNMLVKINVTIRCIRIYVL